MRNGFAPFANPQNEPMGGGVMHIEQEKWNRVRVDASKECLTLRNARRQGGGNSWLQLTTTNDTRG